MIKNCPNTKSSQFIAHFLNCLFSPESLITKLNNGEVIEEVKSKEETKTEKQTKQNEAQNTNNSKKSKKNKKKNRKHNGEANEAKEVKQEPKLFEIKNLSTKNFKTLVEDNKNSKYLKMKPDDFYKRIKFMVMKRYGYELPEKFIDLECRKSHKNKIATLRDLCLKIGIKIHSKNYELSEEEGEAKILPFTEDDIVEIVPKIKNFEIVNLDLKKFISNAKAAMKEGYFEQAFEYLNQAININLQVAGPINKEAVSCLTELANIHFKFGDYNQACQLQTKCVILTEKIYGRIHSKTAQAYSNLANITTVGSYTKAFEYMKRALYIYEIICGDNHPEISSTYSSLGFMYLEIEDSQSAIECFKHALYRNISMYGEQSMQVANSYQVIASAYQNTELFRNALDNQMKSHEILEKLFEKDDPIIKNSLATINQYTRLSVEKEKFKQIEQQSKFFSFKIFSPKTAWTQQ